MLVWRHLIGLGLIAVGLALAGCTAVGYAVGDIIDTRLRRPVARTQWATLPVGTRVWVTTATDSTLNGRLTAASLYPDALTLLVRDTAATPWRLPGGTDRSVVVVDPSALSVPSTTYRALATSLGVVADVALVVIWRHHLNETGFKPNGLE